MMVLTFGACAMAEVVARAASDKAVMRVFIAGLSWVAEIGFRTTAG